jgi:hypothetical protein
MRLGPYNSSDYKGNLTQHNVTANGKQFSEWRLNCTQVAFGNYNY